MLQSDAYTDTLDMALTAAEENLQKLLPGFKPYEISEAFAIHVLTHLSTELFNIADHGHRNDDPENAPLLQTDSAKQHKLAQITDILVNHYGEEDEPFSKADLKQILDSICEVMDAAEKKGGLHISITEREHATILAALRLWQEADEHNRGDLRDIAEVAGAPLGYKEIDVLCERINFTGNREM